jgi:hypothetical protein
MIGNLLAARDSRPARIGLVLVGIALGAILASGAVAISSSSFTYSPPRVGYYSIHPMALAPKESEWLYKIDYSGAGLTTIADAGVRCFNTGVNIPNGSQILGVATFFKSGPGSDISLWFFRNNLSTDASDALASRIVVDDTNVRKFAYDSIPANLASVNNAVYAYGIGFCFSLSSNPQFDTIFEGARIDYRYFTAGD